MTQALVQFNPDQEQITLIRKTIAPTVTPDEFKLFIAACQHYNLDPLARQIYAISRYDFQAQGNKMSIQTSIDGYRLLAERSGKYAGQLGPFWCGEDGQWVDVWVKSTPPVAARVGILRSDFKEPIWAVAKYESYVQKKKQDGVPTSMWAKMPDVMLAKCAESLGLRRTFPAELSGLYTQEEMAQADNPIDVPAAVVEPPHNSYAPVASTKVVDADPVQSADAPHAQKPLTYLDALNAALKLRVCKNKADFAAFVSASMGVNGEQLTQEQLAALLQGIEQAAQQPQASAA